MLSHKVSIKDEILKLLSEPKFRYNGITFNILGIPSFFFTHKFKKQSVSSTVYLLKKKGYVDRVGVDKIMISKKGRKYIESRVSKHQLFNSPFDKKSIKDLLVIFDIPEDRKAEREWFRRQLRTFNYEMVQRSVWLGPSPLPKEFVAYIKEIGLGKNIKMFKLAKSKVLKSTQE